MFLSINNFHYTNLHFVGILGSGMSAIAQYCSFLGLHVSGSDRLLDSPDTQSIRDNLEKLGCILTDQNGSGITDATQAIVLSTAIEETNSDIVAAKKKGIPLFHRSDVLAAIVASKRAIAIAGTSGKSTVTGMVFEFLFSCNKEPSVVSGANLLRLEEQGLIGNAYKGASDILVIEADESDGTLVKYHPDTSVVLNISKDHKPISETIGLFSTLAKQSHTVFINADDKQLSTIQSNSTYGTTVAADEHPSEIIALTPQVKFLWRNQTVTLALPGMHNLSNCLAAFSVCLHFGCTPQELCKAAAVYKGVKRRFEFTTCKTNVIVIDDYAHNPEKIRAALTTAQGFSSRVFAVFQPHGFGPTRFLKDDFIQMFGETLRDTDTLYLLPIYYAGGTAQKDISSDDIISQIKKFSKNALLKENRDLLMDHILTSVQPNDAILIMGARDPSLGSLSQDIIARLNTKLEVK